MTVLLTRIILLLFLYSNVCAQDNKFDDDFVSRSKLEQAQELALKGNQLFVDGKYQAALKFYQNAHELLPDLQHLMIIALLYSKISGHCPKSYQAWKQALIFCDRCKDHALIINRMKKSTQQCTSTLTLTSLPEARVYLKVNNEYRYKGLSPVSMVLLKGSHNIKMTADGYQDREQRVALGDDRSEDTYHIVLQKETNLSINRNPTRFSDPGKIKSPSNSLQENENQIVEQGWFKGVMTPQSTERKHLTYTLVGLGSMSALISVVFRVLAGIDHNQVQHAIRQGQITTQQQILDADYNDYYYLSLDFAVLGSVSLLGALCIWLYDYHGPGRKYNPSTTTSTNSDTLYPSNSYSYPSSLFRSSGASEKQHFIWSGTGFTYRVHF